MEAAAKPLPNEDTTPPVTKMYFADTFTRPLDCEFWLCVVCTIKYIARSGETVRNGC